MIGLYAGSCLASFLVLMVYIGFFNKKDIWFLMSFISQVIFDAGYLSLALSRSLGEALLANRIVYLGSVFIPFFLLMTVMKVCKFKYPDALPFILSFVNAAMLFITVSTGYLDIYYKSASFAVVNGVGTLTKEYGPLHSVYYVFLAAYFSAMIGVIVRSFYRQKIVSYKHALTLAAAVFLNISIYFVEKIFKINFEALTCTYVVTAVFLLFLYKAIEDFNVDSVLQSSLTIDSTGVILFDMNGCFKGCNDDAARLFPELYELKLEYPVPDTAKQLQATVTPALTGAVENTIYRHGDRIYRVVDKPIYRMGLSRGRQIGTAVLISDDTPQQEYLQMMSSYNERLEQEVAQKTAHVRAMHDNLIFGMADMVEGRDPNTGGHIKRTSSVVSIFVERLRQLPDCTLPDSFLKNVAKAAPMHDLGKITIDDVILRKPGKYTEEEYAVMQTHAARGAEIVGKILKREDDEEFYSIAVNVAHYHHEKFDGSGYPQGLKGANIPVEARIMALADVFDALVSERCYKKSYSFEQAFSIISDSLGQHFDPELGSVFLSCAPELTECCGETDRQVKIQISGGTGMGKFTVRQSSTGYVFSLSASNGEVIGTGEVYAAKSGCLNGVESVRANCGSPVEDQTAVGAETLKNPKYEVYKDAAGKFRFRLKARNGEIILASEGYASKSGCLNGIESVKANAPTAKIED